MLVPAFADAKQVGPPTSAVLLRHQPHRRGEVTTTAVLLTITDLCGQHTCSDRTHAGNRHQALADSVVGELEADFSVDLVDLFPEALEMHVQTLEDRDQSRRQVMLCQDSRQTSLRRGQPAD